MLFNYFCIQFQSFVNYRRRPQRGHNHSGDSVGFDETSIRDSSHFSNPFADTISSQSSRDESVYEAMNMRYYKPLVEMQAKSNDLYATICPKVSEESKEVGIQAASATTEQ